MRKLINKLFELLGYALRSFAISSIRIVGRNSEIGGYFLIEGTPSAPNPRL